jgi:hypothetical protein
MLLLLRAWWCVVLHAERLQSPKALEYVQAHSIILNATTHHRTVAHTAYKRGVTFLQAAETSAEEGDTQSSAHNIGEAATNLQTAVVHFVISCYSHALLCGCQFRPRRSV